MGNEQSAKPLSSSDIEKNEPKPVGIVVVGSGQAPQNDRFPDTYISRLNTCPSFEPITGLNSTPSDTKPKSGDLVSDLDWKSASKASARLQDHLKSCAETVAVDQNSLTTRIRLLDQQSNQVLLKYSERQRSFAKYAEHTRKIEDISASLKRIRMKLDVSFSMFEELNNCLPEEDQINIQ